MESPIYEEWIHIVTSLPNNKASGPSGVSNEMLKHLGLVVSWKISMFMFNFKGKGPL